MTVDTYILIDGKVVEEATAEGSLRDVLEAMTAIASNIDPLEFNSVYVVVTIIVENYYESLETELCISLL